MKTIQKIRIPILLIFGIFFYCSNLSSQTCNIPFNITGASTRPYDPTYCHDSYWDKTFSNIFDASSIAVGIAATQITPSSIDQCNISVTNNCKRYYSIGSFADEIFSISTNRLVVSKYDDDLIVIWSKTYALPILEGSSPLTFRPKDIKVKSIDSDEGAIICGTLVANANSPTTQYGNGFIAKIDSAGNMLWLTIAPNNSNPNGSDESSISSVAVFCDNSTEYISFCGYINHISYSRKAIAGVLNANNGTLIDMDLVYPASGPGLLMNRDGIFYSNEFRDIKVVSKSSASPTCITNIISCTGFQRDFETLPYFGNLDNDILLYSFEFNGTQMLPIDYRTIGNGVNPIGLNTSENDEVGISIAVNDPENNILGSITIAAEFSTGTFAWPVNWARKNPIIANFNLTSIRNQSPALNYIKKIDQNPINGFLMINPISIFQECLNPGKITLLSFSEDFNSMNNSYTSLIELNEPTGNIYRMFHEPAGTSILHPTRLFNPVDFVSTSKSKWNNNYGSAILYNYADPILWNKFGTYKIEIKGGSDNLCANISKTISINNYNEINGFYQDFIFPVSTHILNPNYLFSSQPLQSTSSVSLLNSEDCARFSYEIVAAKTNTKNTTKNEKNSNISVFPNPVINGVVFIENFNNVEPNEASIYSMSGKVLFENLKFTGKIEIDLVNYPKGIYLVEVKNNSGNYRFKFVLL